MGQQGDCWSRQSTRQRHKGVMARMADAVGVAGVLSCGCDTKANEPERRK